MFNTPDFPKLDQIANYYRVFFRCVASIEGQSVGHSLIETENLRIEFQVLCIFLGYFYRVFHNAGHPEIWLSPRPFMKSGVQFMFIKGT